MPRETCLEIVQDASCVVQQIALLGELPRLPAGARLPQRDFPHSLVVLPFGPHHLSVERHVLLQVENIGDLVQVFMDIRRVGEEAGPVWVKSEVVSVGMGGNVAGAAFELAVSKTVKLWVSKTCAPG